MAGKNNLHILQVYLSPFYDLLEKKSAMERTYWDYNQFRKKTFSEAGSGVVKEPEP
jgi:hypothetical protein